MRIALLLVSLFSSGYSFAADQDKTSVCLEGLKNDRRFSLIANHLVLDGQDKATPQMLADETRPDIRQQSAIADLIDARSECVNLSPNKVSIGLHLAFLSTVQDLYNGKMTFGEFNKKWNMLFGEITKPSGEVPEHPPSHQHHH